MAFWKALYLDNKMIHSGVLCPQTFDILNDYRYSDFFAILRGATQKASIFNPYTYFYILQRIIPTGKKLFCPVLSWCTPVIAYHNLASYDHLVVCDVIPNVVNSSLELNGALNARKSFLQEEKTMEGYCCPSEELNSTHEFGEKYKDFFDTVFFSPPYFNLELYPGENQSTTKFKTYNEWLSGYWEETVKLCHETLKPGGTFSFVVVQTYYEPTAKTQIEISQDMLNICKKYFTHKETKLLSWGGFDIKKQNHTKRNEVVEDIHILTK